MGGGIRRRASSCVRRRRYRGSCRCLGTVQGRCYLGPNQKPRLRRRRPCVRRECSGLVSHATLRVKRCLFAAARVALQPKTANRNIQVLDVFALRRWAGTLEGRIEQHETHS